jgi:hypothetical protein
MGRRCLIVVGMFAAGCSNPGLSELEVTNLMSRAREVQAAEDFVRDAIEILTEFDEGTSLSDVATQIADFWNEQVNCATGTADSWEVVLDYGVVDDGCTWRGRNIGGQHEVRVTDLGPEIVSFTHEFLDYTDGVVHVDGELVVTWEPDTFTRVVDADWFWWIGDDLPRQVVGQHSYASVDATERLLGDVTIDGSRVWVTDDGSVDQEMEGVEYRLADPVPSAGVWRMIVQRTEIIEMSFGRPDGAFEVDVVGASQPFRFEVDTTGGITKL